MKKGRPISLLLIITLLSIIIIHDGPIAVSALPHRFSEEDHDQEDEDNSMRLELIHRHSLAQAPKTHFERLQELLAKDVARHSVVAPSSITTTSSTRRINRKDLEKRELSGDLGLPIHSATDFGSAEYGVKLKLGTPMQKLFLIADTGSCLTWVKCKLHRRDKKMLPVEINDAVQGYRRHHNVPGQRIFKAYRSSSFRTIPCSSHTCREDLLDLFSLPRCPSPKDPCAFDHSYTGGDNTFGFFANETVIVGHRLHGKKLRMLMGCSLTYKGSATYSADGILGMGFHPYSFAMQAAKEVGGKFSFCLVDHLSPKNITSYLLFGPNKDVEKNRNVMQYTELILGIVNIFYGVNIEGISVGGKMLDIPRSTWDFSANGGAIMDSGTSSTMLSLPAYRPVMDALQAHLSKYPQVALPVEANILEYCFNATTYDESLMPKLAIHFCDGAVFHPLVSSYIVELGAPLDGIRCIGFVPARSQDYSVIGNIMQQQHLWEYDLVNTKLGFVPSNCS